MAAPITKPPPGSARALYESLSSIGTSWPRDALRPDASFGTSIRWAAERALCDPVPEQDPLPTSSSHQGVLSRIATRNLEYRESLSKAERETVERAIAALLSIKQGDASKEYPVPTSILQPEANPIYYTRLADMLTKATKGERVGITFAQRIRLFFGRPI